MMREIVHIDEDKCNGCSLCIPNCHEGALQIIDGKAILISDLMCDGLGACLGHCPEGALTIEKREAEPYDEVKVIAEMAKKGKNVVVAHLQHLKDHNETVYLQQGINYLEEHKGELTFPVDAILHELQNTTMNTKTNNLQPHASGGCPGARTMAFNQPMHIATSNESYAIPSQLTHWPIQLHLINPAASHFQKCDLLIAADCSAFSFGAFHLDFLTNRKVIIACPKLDSNKEVYVEKIKSLIDDAKVNTITVVIMEVPCCGGLLQMVEMAVKSSTRKVPIKAVTIGIQGTVLQEEWI